MIHLPLPVKHQDIAPILRDAFRGREAITCYIGSNAATPTAAIEALTEAVRSGRAPAPFPPHGTPAAAGAGPLC